MRYNITNYGVQVYNICLELEYSLTTDFQKAHPRET